ncbi:hypothetical protein D3C85_1101840 [compost metagenome]
MRLKPRILAAITETPMVATTTITTSASGLQPRAAICSNVMRIPNSATPMRSTLRAVNSMPALHLPSPARKFTDMPSNRAKSITGAP